MKKWGMFLGLFLGGCAGLPAGIQPVENFELSRYFGTWYEIARLDHSFERGLDRVTAEYTLREDGSIRVLNKGFARDRNAWKTAEGKALFVQSPDTGYLKVSFFGPFYGAYVVIALDQQNYSYALVCGPDRSYLWLLARKPQLDEGIKVKLIAQAKQLGFAVEELIFVSHDEYLTQ